jgi:hypothetical protein
MSSIYIVGSSKSGIGKSLVTMALIDYLSQIGQDCFLVETDPTCTDVHKSYQHIPFLVLNLASKLGEIALIDLCDEHRDKVIIVNATAEGIAGIEKYSQDLIANLTNLNRNVITLWILDRLKSSLKPLERYVHIMNGTIVHVVINNFFGSKTRFRIYNQSNLKTIIEQTGQTLILDRLEQSLCDRIFDCNSTIHNAAAGMSLASHLSLTTWRNKCKNIFEEIIVNPNYLQSDVNLRSNLRNVLQIGLL